MEKTGFHLPIFGKNGVVAFGIGDHNPSAMSASRRQGGNHGVF